MSKSGIHDTVAGHLEDKLINTDPRQQIVLGKQSIIGDVIKVKEALQMIVIFGDARQHAFSSLTEFRRDQTVGIVLPQPYERR